MSVTAIIPHYWDTRRATLPLIVHSIRGADRILVFQGGKIIEEGRHGELVAKGGAYARLHAVTQG